MESWGWVIIGLGSSLAALGFILGAFWRRLLAPFALLLVAAWVIALVAIGIDAASCSGYCSARLAGDSQRWIDLYAAGLWGVFLIAGILAVAWLGAGLSILLKRAARSSSLEVMRYVS